MNRRKILVGGAAVLAAPLVALAQPKLPRVGFVLNSATLASMQGEEPEQTVMRGFIHGMRALGYVDGKTVVIERRTAAGRLERLEQIIRELEALPTDVIVITGSTMAHAARKATSKVPVVAAGMGNPVPSIVESYARPGGNITGLAPSFGPELIVKRLEQVLEILPDARRVAYLGVAADWARMDRERGSAMEMGLDFRLVDVPLPDLATALRRLEEQRPDAVLVPVTSELFVHMQTIARFARKIALPDFHGFYQAVEAGGLLSYGHDSFDLFRRSAAYVDRILRGATPATMPIEQTSKFELVINVSTARTLGLTVPRSLLVRADRIIE